MNITYCSTVGALITQQQKLISTHTIEYQTADGGQRKIDKKQNRINNIIDSHTIITVLHRKIKTSIETTCTSVNKHLETLRSPDIDT